MNFVSRLPGMVETIVFGILHLKGVVAAPPSLNYHHAAIQRLTASSTDTLLLHDDEPNEPSL